MCFVFDNCSLCKMMGLLVTTMVGFLGGTGIAIRVLGTVKASEVPEVGIVAKAQMTLMTFSVVDSTVELKGLEMIGISETDYQIRLHLGTGIFFLMSCENSNSMN